MENKTVDYTYEYNKLDESGTAAEITIAVKIPSDEDTLDEGVLEVLREMDDPLMKYLDEDDKIRVKLKQFICAEDQKYEDEYADRLIEQARSEEGQAKLEALIRETERHYKEEILQFADRVRPTDDEIFAQSFHRLVHSTSLEEILQRERSYATVIADMTVNMEKEVDALNASQQEEMESKINQLDITTTSEDINNLLAQQYTTQSFVRKRYESELEAMKGHQRNEYRDWITGQVSKIFETSPVATPLGNRSSMFVSQQPSMEESFTIHLGSQLKHMHNIRILSANVTDLCSPLHVDESLNGLNMALGLYSSSLCGVVVLTPSMQAQANKDIIRNANHSTEFHFDQIDDQLEKIEEQIRNMQPIGNSTLKTSNSIATDLSQQIGSGNGSGSGGGIDNNGSGSATGAESASINSSPRKSSSRLKTGDFFITKHSNLSQTHVIFHLISDEPINSPSEINSRHPVILGLRHILKTASRHDVTTLTIPALLRHEMSEDMTIQWCIRRAELLFKCAKGFMIESASWGGAELSTLQLLLPHDISEELFSTLAAMVPNVFRVANPKILVENK